MLIYIRRFASSSGYIDQILYNIIMYFGFYHFRSISKLIRMKCMNTSIWEILITIFSGVQALAVVIALIYGAKQLSDATKNRHLSVFFRLADLFDNPKSVESRKYIFNKLPQDTKALSREDYELIRDTWNMMDQVGIIAHYDLISRNMLLEIYSLRINRLWEKLEPYIIHYRDEQGMIAVYFEELAKLSKLYRKQRFSEKETPYYESDRNKSSIIKAEPQDNDI
jgi:hypothetical protein